MVRNIKTRHSLWAVLSLLTAFLVPQAAHACSNPTATAGAMIYNTDHAVMQYCDGTNWIAMGPNIPNVGCGVETEYDTPGIHTYTVPFYEGCSGIVIHAYGAGGGFNSGHGGAGGGGGSVVVRDSDSTDIVIAGGGGGGMGAGGGGGYAAGIVNAAPGTTFTVYVGGGGEAACMSDGSDGGAYNGSVGGTPDATAATHGGGGGGRRGANASFTGSGSRGGHGGDSTYGGGGGGGRGGNYASVGSGGSGGSGGDSTYGGGGGYGSGGNGASWPLGSDGSDGNCGTSTYGQACDAASGRGGGGGGFVHASLTSLGTAMGDYSGDAANEGPGIGANACDTPGGDGRVTFKIGICSDPLGSAGTMIYNTDDNVMQYCNGNGWIPLGPVPGAGGAGCSGPSGATGAMIYNIDEGVMQYCDGTNWIHTGR